MSSKGHRRRWGSNSDKKLEKTMRTITRQTARRANVSDDTSASGGGQGKGLGSRRREILCGLCLAAGLLWCTMAAALPGSPWPPLPSFTDVLFKIDFDDAYYNSNCCSETVATDYGLLVSSWSGYALNRSTGTLLLPYLVAAMDNTGKTNIACGDNAAALRFWISPNWYSQSLNGTGPGAEARLLELDAIESNF